MRRDDILSILALGEITAISLIFILKSLGVFFGWFWFLLLALPILALIALFITYLLGKKIPVFFQFGKFVSVGVANTGVDFGILNILILIGGATGGFAYSIFKGLSFLGATIHSYFWNKFWTFDKDKTKEVGREFLQFFTVSLVGLIINVGIASIIVNLIGPQGNLSLAAWANIGAAAGSISALTWNFIGYKFIVFKK